MEIRYRRWFIQWVALGWLQQLNISMLHEIFTQKPLQIDLFPVDYSAAPWNCINLGLNLLN